MKLSLRLFAGRTDRTFIKFLIINKSNCKVSSKLAGNVDSYEMDFE